MTAMTASDAMRLLERATRPLGIAYGAGNLHGWNPQARNLFRHFPGETPWLDDAWSTACRRTIRTASHQALALSSFRFSLSPLGHLNNCGRFVQAAYATEILLVEVTGFPSTQRGSTGLVRELGLTGTEVAILRELRTGASVNEIADRRRSTSGTIRQHLKSIRRKTGLVRMPALVRFAAEQSF